MGKIKARFLIHSPNVGRRSLWEEGRVRYVFLFLFVFTIFLSPLIYLQTKRPNEVQAGWWNDHFQYRQRLPISNASGETKTDFQFKLELDTQTLITDGQMQSSCSDIRFTDHSGKELHYFLEPNTCNTTTTILFVKIPTIPTTGTNIFLYYGNSQASSKSSTSNVFIRELDAAIANWPLDDSDPTQSYARVINQGKDLGRDIVINGGFDSDTVWLKGTCWTIANGKASCNGTGGASPISQPLPLIPGKIYEVTFTVLDYTGGSIQFYLGSSAGGTLRTANGTYTQNFVAAGNTTFYFYPTGAGYVGSIDNVSVRQVDIPSSASIDSSQELLTDGDMEAVDTSVWPSAQGLSTKDTTDPQAGTRNLRISRTATNNPTATQASVTTSGKSYRLLGYARSDGSTSPRIISGSPVIWSGSTPTSWQNFNFVFNSTSTSLALQANNADSGTEYSEFDSLSLVEVSPMVGRNTNGVTVGAAANGHLERAYSFDGTNDVVNIYSSDLNSAFNPDEGTLVAWAKVSDVGVWTDGTVRRVLHFYVDGNNAIEMFKSSNNNTIVTGYKADGLYLQQSTSTNSSNWQQIVISWSKSNDEVRHYFNGAQSGSTQTGLGTFIGNLVSSGSVSTAIGARGTTGSTPWSGMINDVRLYNRALSPEEIADMYSDHTDIQVYATDNYPGKELIRQFDADITLGTPATAELAPGPIAHWSFDSLEGSTVRDVSGNGNNGTNSGATLLTEDQCISGKCMRFDGVDDNIVTSYTKPFETGTLSYSAWFKVPDEDQGGMIITKRTNGGNFAQLTLMVGSNCSGGAGQNLYVLEILSGGGSSRCIHSNSDVADNKWHHAAVVRTSTNLTLFLDGKQVSTLAYPALNLNNFDPVTIGDGNGSYRFNGTIDEVKIYPYARSAEEIRMDYLAGAASAGSGAVLGVGDQSFLSEGLVGYWKMDEASWNGTTGEVKDASGNGNHGTATGAVTGAGKYGSSGSFDGVDDVVNLGDVDGSATLYEVTVSMWFKPHNYCPGNAALLSRSSNFYIHCWENRLYFNSVSNNGYTTIAPGDYTLNEWNHVTMTYNSHTNTVRTYMQGVLTGEGQWDGLPIASNSSQYLIGRRTNFYSGLIDEVRVYNRALSPAEVRALYEWAPGPIGHWKLDEGEGTTAYDSSGNGNHGTLVNGPEYVPGQFGNALSFDRNNDTHVSIITSGIYATAGTTTLGFWYKDGGEGSYIVAKGGGQVYISRSSGGNTNFRVYTSESIICASTSSPLSDANWHFYSLTYDGTTLRGYVDGQEECSIVGNEEYLQASTSEWQIGRRPTTGGAVSGLIDDVKIYNYARTAEQIKEDMMAGRPLDHESVEDPTPTKQTISFSTGNEREDVIDGPGADPIAYWDFNERSGTTLTDKSGNGNNGTLVNGPEWVSGKYGAGLRFDGTNQMVSVDYDPILNLGNSDFSISSMVYLSTTSNDSKYIVSRAGTGATNKDYAVYINNQNKFSATIWADDGSSGGSCSSIEQIPMNRWVSVVYSYSAGIGRCYVNGKLSSSSTTFTGNRSTIGTENLIIGSRPAVGSSYFNGIVDEVKIFDYALTPAQVAYEYNRGAPIAHWMMDECQGSVIHDASGNENHGTLTIGPSGTQTNVGTCDTAGSAWGNGKVGRLNSSMSFDGNDYINLNSSLNLTQPYSFSAWVKTTSNGAMNIVGNYNGNVRSGPYLLVGTGKLQFGNSGSIAGNVTINDGNWHHVMMTGSGSTINLYVDGVLDVSGTLSLPINHTDNILIGARYFNSLPSQYFVGQIDDVRIYNYALSADQVKTLYNNGAVSFR